MGGFLLDTNILSELRRPKRNRSVVEFATRPSDPQFFTSEISFAEIRFGVDVAADKVEALVIENWLRDTLRPWFGERVLIVSEDSIVRWRHIVEEGRKQRLTYPEPDTLLAAVAHAHDMIVVTRDWKPFEKVGVPTLDPWQAIYRDGGGACKIYQ